MLKGGRKHIRRGKAIGEKGRHPTPRGRRRCVSDAVFLRMLVAAVCFVFSVFVRRCCSFRVGRWWWEFCFIPRGGIHHRYSSTAFGESAFAEARGGFLKRGHDAEQFDGPQAWQIDGV
jgi:hypothetical protein